MPVIVPFVKFKAVGEIFDRVAVQIDFEFVHSLRMVAGSRDGAKNGVAEIDYEHGACFATEDIEVRDVEADVLTSDG